VINKDYSHDATVEVALPEGYSNAVAFRLSGPSLESKDHVTFAGTEVSADGTWNPGPPEKVTTRAHFARLLAPHAGAVLLQLRRN
jgi:hypothetical protein